MTHPFLKAGDRVRITGEEEVYTVESLPDSNTLVINVNSEPVEIEKLNLNLIITI